MNNYKYYFFGNFISSIMPFILMPLLTRYLTPSEYGKLSIFLLCLSALNSILGFNVHKFIFRKCLDSTKDDIRNYLYNSMLLLVISFSLFLTLLIVLHFSGFDFQDIIGISKENLAYCAVLSFASFIIEIRLYIWQACEQAKKYIHMQILRALSNFFFALLFVILLERGYDGRVESYIYSYILIAIISFTSLWSEGYLSKKKIDIVVIKDSIKFGFPLVPTALISIVILFFERFTISGFSSMDNVGFYVIALQISTVVTIIFDSIHKQYSVHVITLLDKNSFDARVKAIRITFLVFFLALICYLMSIYIFPEFVLWFLGSEYKQVASIINIVVLGTTLKGMANTLFFFFYQSGETRSILKITAIYFLFHLSLLYPVVMFYGLYGAVYLYFISNLVQILVTIIVVRSKLNTTNILNLRVVNEIKKKSNLYFKFCTSRK